MDNAASVSGPRICPLCQVSPVEWLYINFQEKVLMCIDPNCDYPFGYEELQIMTVEDDEKEHKENKNSDTDSISSNSDLDILLPDRCRKLIARHRKIKNRQRKIRKEMRDIEQSCKQIHNIKKEEVIDVNQVYLNKMKEIQDEIGKQMLKSQEMEIMWQREMTSRTEELNIHNSTLADQLGTIKKDIQNYESNASSVNNEAAKMSDPATNIVIDLKEESSNQDYDSFDEDGSARCKIKLEIETSAASATETYNAEDNEKQISSENKKVMPEKEKTRKKKSKNSKKNFADKKAKAK